MGVKINGNSAEKFIITINVNKDVRKILFPFFIVFLVNKIISIKILIVGSFNKIINLDVNLFFE